MCNDFSERYVEALKIKLNSDNIFKIDDDEDDLAFDELANNEKISKINNTKNRAQKNKKTHRQHPPRLHRPPKSSNFVPMPPLQLQLKENFNLHLKFLPSLVFPKLNSIFLIQPMRVLIKA